MWRRNHGCIQNSNPVPVYSPTVVPVLRTVRNRVGVRTRQMLWGTKKTLRGTSVTFGRFLHRLSSVFVWLTGSVSNRAVERLVVPSHESTDAARRLRSRGVGAGSLGPHVPAPTPPPPPPSRRAPSVLFSPPLYLLPHTFLPSLLLRPVRRPYGVLPLRESAPGTRMRLRFTSFSSFPTLSYATKDECLTH